MRNRCPSHSVVHAPLWRRLRGIALGLLVASLAAPAARAAGDSEPYTIQPGDALAVSVWKEEDLQLEVLVRPDGGISFPLVGDLQAASKSVQQVRDEIAARIEKYIPDPAVNVAVIDIQGHVMYVLGKVNQPGAYVMNRELDVMQALSRAGGTTTFADLNDIKILRRNPDGQVAIPFRYNEVESGRNLEQNILLRSGDVVVVP